MCESAAETPKLVYTLLSNMNYRDSRVRAPVTKAIVELLDRQPPSIRAAVRKDAAEAIEHVESASRVDWIPLRTQLRILRAVHTELGQDGFDDFSAKHFACTVEQPLARSVFDTTVRLFGVGPGPIYKMFPQSWAMMSSGCGMVVCTETDPSGTSIRIVDLPVAEPDIELYVVGFRATFRGVLDAFKCDGSVEFLAFDRARRESRYRATWR